MLFYELYGVLIPERRWGKVTRSTARNELSQELSQAVASCRRVLLIAERRRQYSVVGISVAQYTCDLASRNLKPGILIIYNFAPFLKKRPAEVKKMIAKAARWSTEGSFSGSGSCKLAREDLSWIALFTIACWHCVWYPDSILLFHCCNFRTSSLWESSLSRLGTARYRSEWRPSPYAVYKFALDNNSKEINVKN